MAKNIILCYDGTGNEYGPNNTNVVGIFEAILRNDDQIAFYDPGVGTFNFLGRTVGKKVGILLGKAFGYGLQQNLEDGYEYLMNHFEPEDKLFLFGFSRGAFTARALAGMLYRFGVLQRGSKNLIPYVSKYYLSGRFDAAEGFKGAFCHDCQPHFIGVWDTVGSLGHIHGRKFFDTRLNPYIRYGYQAVAIDEKRKKFSVSLWDESKKSEEQTIEQVWFAGVHSDVGGWYEERHLSDIAFAWLVDKASQAGLKLKSNWEGKLDQDAAGVLHASHAGLWKLWRPVEREIMKDSKIHQSVFDRMEEVDAYRPTLPDRYVTANNPSYIQLVEERDRRRRRKASSGS